MKKLIRRAACICRGADDRCMLCGGTGTVPDPKPSK